MQRNTIFVSFLQIYVVQESDLLKYTYSVAPKYIRQNADGVLE